MFRSAYSSQKLDAAGIPAGPVMYHDEVFNDPHILAEVSRNLGEAMVGRSVSSMPEEEMISDRGW